MAVASPTYVFLDTNTALHFKRADQIDWRELTGAANVVLVAAPVFLRELEMQKVHNPSRKLRERAAGTIKWLSTLISNGPASVRERVSILFLTHEPQLSFELHHLSQAINDDHLIASAIDFRTKHGGRVLVATADIGMTVKLGAHGLDVLRLPDESELPAKSDPLETEVTRLKLELSQLQKRIPELSLLFRNQEITLTIKRRVAASEPINRTLSDLKARYPKLIMPKSSSESLSGLPALSRLVRDFGARIGVGPSAASVDQYNDALEKFFLSYEKYLENLEAWKMKGLLLYKFNFMLSNDGTAPASDIDVALAFHEGVQLAARVRHFPPPPEPPRAPEPPRNPKGVASLTAEPIATGDTKELFYPNFSYRIDYSKNTTIDRSKRTINFWFKHLKHGYLLDTPAVYLAYPEPSAVKSHPIEVEISAAELARPIVSRLHLIIEDN